MYESPINIIISKLCTKLESDCIKSVQSYGFDVDKEELAKALYYDRNQYEKGHKDGYNEGIDDAIKVIKGHYRMEAMDILEQLKEGGKNE